MSSILHAILLFRPYCRSRIKAKRHTLVIQFVSQQTVQKDENTKSSSSAPLLCTSVLRRSITRGSVQYNRVVVFHHTWECAVQQSCGVPSHVRVCSTTELRCSITRGNVQYNRVAVFHHTWECAVQQSCGVPSHVGVCSTTELRCSITRGSVQYNRVAVFHHTWECAVQQSCGVPSHVGVCSVRNKSGETRV